MRVPSARRFDAPAGAAAPACSAGSDGAAGPPRGAAGASSAAQIADLGAAPTQSRQLGGAIRSATIAKGASGFGFRLTAEMIVVGFADGKAGVPPALAGMPIGWRVVSAREEKTAAGAEAEEGAEEQQQGAEVPTATIEEFAEFAQGCPEGTSVVFDLRQPAANPAQYVAAPKPKERGGSDEGDQPPTFSEKYCGWRRLCYLLAVVAPGFLVAVPTVYMAPWDDRTVACQLYGRGTSRDGAFAWFMHSIAAATLLIVCLLKRLEDGAPSAHRRRAGIWKADMLQGVCGVLLVHAATTWVAVWMNAYSLQNIGSCVGGGWLETQAKCLRAGFVWEPAGSNECAWFVVNWALDLLLRVPLLRALLRSSMYTRNLHHNLLIATSKGQWSTRSPLQSQCDLGLDLFCLRTATASAFWIYSELCFDCLWLLHSGGFGGLWPVG